MFSLWRQCQPHQRLCQTGNTCIRQLARCKVCEMSFKLQCSALNMFNVTLYLCTHAQVLNVCFESRARVGAAALWKV